MTRGRSRTLLGRPADVDRVHQGIHRTAAQVDVAGGRVAAKAPRLVYVWAVLRECFSKVNGAISNFANNFVQIAHVTQGFFWEISIESLRMHNTPMT